jgi:hypothetical protein
MSALDFEWEKMACTWDGRMLWLASRLLADSSDLLAVRRIVD